MKKLSIYLACLLAISLFWGCKKDDTYPGATLSPYIALLDLRDIYKGQDVTLTKDKMFGATKITGLVISDHSGNNIPSGLLVVQDRRRLGQTRGMAFSMGADAANYVPGDSVVIHVEGGVLKRENGILQVTGLSKGSVEKISSGNVITLKGDINSAKILADPEAYESTLIPLTKVGFDPSYPAGSTYAGDRIINDSYGEMLLHTEGNAAWANKPLPFFSNFTGIVFRSTDGKLQLWPRVESDIVVLSATAPKIAPVLISGYLADPTGSDGNYEYIQLMATKNIDFAVTPFSVVTTNNAGNATPTGFPANGWATGDLRTYKFNLTSGTVQKGQYFYVGANKNIWGANSTDISSSRWFGKMYASENGDDFGTKTSNLLANSGNAAGIAVFDKIHVDETTKPVDVIFYGGNGSLYTAGPPEKGFLITNTDFYDEKNPLTQEAQPFYKMGSNTGKFAFPTATNFAKLGGTYNRTTGRWTQIRVQTSTPLTVSSTVAEIEGGITLEE